MPRLMFFIRFGKFSTIFFLQMIFLLFLLSLLLLGLLYVYVDFLDGISEALLFFFILFVCLLLRLGNCN